MKELFWLLKVKALNKTLRAMHETWFYGFRADRWFVETSAFQRFTEWYNEGFCFAMSALAMIILRDNPTARIVQGHIEGVKNPNSGGLYRHAFVEFKLPWLGWCVMDLSWITPCIANRNAYYRTYSKMVKDWTCSYEEFWKYDFSHDLYMATRRKETSDILDLLIWYGCSDGMAGFTKAVLENWSINEFDMEITAPFHYGNEKLISGRILRDFVKNPKREQPKAKSLRRAAHLRKLYESKSNCQPPTIARFRRRNDDVAT